MVPDSDDTAPITRKTSGAAGQAPRFSWTVRIAYREPTYALRSGADNAYSCRFVVEATDERDAIARAKEEFEKVAARSGVGWAREIERFECERSGDAGRDGG